MSKFEIILPKLFDKQKEIKTDSKRFNVICVGRRSGKTVLCNDLITDTILKGHKVAYFAPTYKMLKEVWKELKSRLQPIITRVSEQDKSVDFITKGSVDFWSLDAFNSVRGRKYHRVIIDEASISPYLEEAWEQAIRPTLIDYLGDSYFFSTPKGANYFKVLFEKGKELDDWQVWQIATKDFNPKISIKELESFKDSMPSSVYRQELEAEFVDLQGALIKREWLKYFDNQPLDLRIGIGVDLAISQKTTADYTAIVVTGIDNDNNIYILDVFRNRLSFQDTKKTIIQFANKWIPQKITIETVAYQSALVQELKRDTNYNIVGITPSKDKVTRFLPIAGKYEQGLISHSRNLPNYFENELLSFPDGSNDDMVDALTYSYDIKKQFTFR